MSTRVAISPLFVSLCASLFLSPVFFIIFVFLSFIAIFGTGIASITYLGGLKLAGAGKTAVLGATAPLFALPLAMLLLREQLLIPLLLACSQRQVSLHEVHQQPLPRFI